MEPSLEEIKQKVMEDNSKENNLESLKVKTFKVVGFKTYDGLKNEYRVYEGQKVLEEQINNFLSTLNHFHVEHVQINVAKNFLPHTTTGEYEEVWYGSVTYHEE